MDKRIHPNHREFWRPYVADHILLHLTTAVYLDSIMAHGLLPRDPTTRHWAGTEAVWTSHPLDPLHESQMRDIHAHVASKGAEFILLHIRTNNQLFRSIDPERTNQVISLDPIAPSDIVRIEYLDDNLAVVRTLPPLITV